MGYKNFHFSIKITPLDLTKIRQHNDYAVVKPEIQKSPVYKKKYSHCFPKIQLQLYRTSGPHQNIRYETIQYNFIATCFSQNHACIFYKRYLHIQNVTFLLLLHLLYTLSYIYTTQRLGLRILERSFGFSTCT